MQASVTQQQLLLQLATLDNQLVTTARKLADLPQDKALAQLFIDTKPLRQEMLELQRAQEDLADKLAKIRDDQQTVKKRIVHDEELSAKTSDPKTAQGVTAELQKLRSRQDELETRELELLEAQDELAAAEKDLAARKAQAELSKAEIEAEKTRVHKELTANMQLLETERDTLAAQISAELLAEYQRLRERNGIGVAQLVNGVSTASGMQLSPGELATLAATPADELVYCPLTGAILVRS